MKFNKNEFENYIKAKNIDYELIEHDILIRSQGTEQSILI